jgi:hypothetical protein
MSRSSPSVRNNVRERRLTRVHAGWGSTSFICAASDRHRRIATRKRCTDSVSADFCTRRSALTTRSMRADNPTCLGRRMERRDVTAAIGASISLLGAKGAIVTESLRAVYRMSHRSKCRIGRTRVIIMID